MTGHLDIFELLQHLSGNKEKIIDEVYVEQHLNSCGLCRSRLSQFKGVEEYVPYSGKAPVLPKSGEVERGIFRPLVSERYYVPDDNTPVAVLNQPKPDLDTGLEVVDIANLHETLGMEGNNDILLGPEEGPFEGWYLGLWSRRTVLLSALDLKNPLGLLHQSTFDLTHKLLSGKTLSEEEYNRTGIGEPKGINDFLYQYRQLILLDYQALSADLLSRADYVLTHAALFQKHFEGPLFKENGEFIGFQEILAQCEKSKNKDKRFLEAAHYSHLYIQSGDPTHSKKAETFISKLQPEEPYNFSGMGYALTALFFQSLSMPNAFQNPNALLNILPTKASDKQLPQSRFAITDRSLRQFIEDIESKNTTKEEVQWDYIDCIGYNRPIQKSDDGRILWRWQIARDAIKPYLSADYTAIVLDLNSGAYLGEADIEVDKDTVLFILQNLNQDTLPHNPVTKPEQCCILIGKK